MTMITPSYLGETIEYSSLHACRSTLEDPTLQQFANQQWKMMGVELPEALIQAADARNLVNMATAAAAEAVAETL